MSVILGPYGFCAGVKRAVEKCLSAASAYGKVYTLHPIIHNKSVVASLEKKGVFYKKDLPDDGMPVVISAHGCDKSTENRLKKTRLVIDATCPFVKKIHREIAFRAENGWQTVIIGDPEHAEIRGIAGQISRCIVANFAEEIDFSLSDKYFVCVQTTYPVKKYFEIKNNIKIIAENLSKTVEFFDSICYTTVERQNKAEETASICDNILIVGDKSSSNCNKLFSTASRFCKNVFFIENVDDLKSLQINIKSGKTGILSGASTPEELTMEVFNRMNEQNVINNAVDEVKEEVNAALNADNGEKREEKAEAEITTMADAMKKIQTRNYREGMRLKTHVVKADVTGITVSVDGGGKNDCGFIAKEEAELDGSYDPANYNVGDEIDAIIIPKESGSKEKAINLSKKAYDALKADDEHVKKILAGEEFTLACNQEIKGGLLGKIGTYTVFVPASQIRIGFVKNLADYVGKPLRLKALPPKEEYDEEGNLKKPRNAKRIVASQKVILEAEKAAKEEEFWSGIYEGAIVKGKVKRFTDFGVFVSLKLMDGLVRNQELSWAKKKITDPSEYLELNKTYDFIVLSANRETGKISLGYKQLQKHPIEIAQEKYPEGSVVKGKVVRIVSFGAFVEIEPGIDGLVHISQINRTRTNDVHDVLNEGDEVEVKVLKYDGDKINLSIKELLPVETATETAEESEERHSAKSSEKGEKKERKAKKIKEDSDDEPREYVSGNSGVTLGDLFNIKLNDEEK